VKGLYVDVLWAEVVLDAAKNFRDLVRLAREDIQIDIIRLFHEVRHDVGGLDELDESVAGLVPLTEMLDLRTTVRLHVDASDEILTEPGDRCRASDGLRTCLRDIQHCMDAPRHLRASAVFYRQCPQLLLQYSSR
jgi:hypothetical protein